MNLHWRTQGGLAVTILAFCWSLWWLDLAPLRHPQILTSLSPSSSNSKDITDRPLILYAFFDTEAARVNLEFFIAHGLHSAADFIFILNGDTDAESIIPKEPNIRYIKRSNECYDLGAFGEVLTTDNMYKGYKRFILMNASIRGPFLPHWSGGCWSDLYLNKVTEEVKLVGMTINCNPQLHIQSMIWATDIDGIETLLHPSESTVAAFRAASPPRPPGSAIPQPAVPGILSCPNGYHEAVAIEVSTTLLIQSAGYKIDVMMGAYHANPNYADDCFDAGDLLFDGHYYGTNLHVFELIFMKSARGVDPVSLEKWTEWTNKSGYRSYDYCHA